jgi:chloramphenicol 3-O phosphotransferase
MSTIKYVAYGLSVMALTAAVYFLTRSPRQLLGMVIIINGPSAVGKTSIIKEFQKRQTSPWLSIGIDNFFVGVLPPKFYLEDKPEHHAVMHGVASEDAHGKLFTLQIGPEGQKIIRGMHRAIAAYAREGNNVIVDYIKYDSAWISDLQESLKGIKVLWVGVTASLESIQQREKARGTSPEGHARSVYHTMHEGMSYDLMLNTDSTMPEQAAEK